MNFELKIGIIGGGQLAWMMADAAQKLGVKLIVQTPKSDDPAVAIADDVIFAPIDDATATAELAKRADVITFENEFIDLEALMALSRQGITFRPRLEALAPLLDKYDQRQYLQTIGLPVPEFVALDTPHKPSSPFGFPVVMKARRHGYDGQGTFILKSQDELDATWKPQEASPMLLEGFVPFERELAVMAARSVTGEVIVYPVVETQQEDQVCRRVIVPANVPSSVQSQVEAIAHTLLNSLDVVGIFGIELFLTQEGKVLVNEIAPRTHNSGHYTLDACEVSQFEMQLRAVSGLPLPSPRLKSAGAVMVNLLGYEYSQSEYLEKQEQIAAIPNAHLYWYGKTQSRPGRKLAHVTVLLESTEISHTKAIIEQIESIWYGASD